MNSVLTIGAALALAALLYFAIPAPSTSTASAAPTTLVTPTPEVASVETPRAHVTSHRLCTSVEHRQPVGALDGQPYAFAAGTSRVSYWLDVRGAVAETLTVIWSRDGRAVSAFDVAIGAGRFRTWAAKSVQPGGWTVLAQDADGRVLASDGFYVEAASDAAPQPLHAAR